MADIVAADFNPPINNHRLFLNPVGMTHLIGFYMYHPYGIQKREPKLIPWIEIHSYNMNHPYGILTHFKDVGNGQGLKLASSLQLDASYCHTFTH